MRVGVKIGDGARLTDVVVDDGQGGDWEATMFVRKEGRRWWGRRYTYERSVAVGDVVLPGERVGVRIGNKIAGGNGDV